VDDLILGHLKFLNFTTENKIKFMSTLLGFVVVGFVSDPHVQTLPLLHSFVITIWENHVSFQDHAYFSQINLLVRDHALLGVRATF